MICYCGRDLGDVTAETPGLCPECGLSMWLQAARRLRPDSAKIAEDYNRTMAPRCVHRSDPCFTRCGVRRVGELWTPISFIERQQWFASAIWDRPHEPLVFDNPKPRF